jgi:hypothetical protein
VVNASLNVGLLGSFMASAFSPNSMGDAGSQLGNDPSPFGASPLLVQPQHAS